MFELTTDLGVMGQFDHPDVIAAMARVEAAATRAGIAMRSNALTKEMAEGLFARGYRAIAGFDVLWLRARTAEFKSWVSD